MDSLIQPRNESRGFPRFGEDIAALASSGLFSAAELRSRAEEALGYYVGNIGSARNSINLICDQIQGESAPSATIIHRPASSLW